MTTTPPSEQKETPPSRWVTLLSENDHALKASGIVGDRINAANEELLSAPTYLPSDIIGDSYVSLIKSDPEVRCLAFTTSSRACSCYLNQESTGCRDVAEDADDADVANDADVTDVADDADVAEDADVADVAEDADDADVAEDAEDAEDAYVEEDAEDADEAEVAEDAEELVDCDMGALV
ncbi:hypothetical protein ABEF95_011553 [Exophiala dermatitidis]